MTRPNSFPLGQWWILAGLLMAQAALSLWSPVTVRAQVATASINGTVTDPSGAAVAGAMLTLRNVARNVERSTTTNDVGNYVLVNILPGRYMLKVSKEGFASASKPEFDLAVNQTTTIDFALRIGSATETVTVEALETGLQTSTAELGNVMSGRSVVNLPLNGRNFTQLLLSLPGASPVNTTQNRDNQQFAGNTIGSFSFPAINGQTNRSNLFLLDGLNDQESFSSTYSVPPIIDDIQEFKVDSHNDQPQFGGVLGGVVNVVTKSGTNQFHGGAWEFLRNSSLDAKDPFTGINLLHQNQFGANIGGPVILPHYNGRNRTFFFGSYEGTRYHVGNANQVLVPTPAQLNGDFTGSNQIYNPYSTTGARDPFRCVGNTPAPLMPGTKLQDQTIGTPCNILPPGLIDPNMQKVAQLLYGPLQPNLTTVTGKNFQKVLTHKQDPNSYNIRIDEQLGQKDAFWGRFSHITSPRDVPGIFGQSNLNNYSAHQLGISWNHTFGPSTNLAVQFGRNYGYSTNPTFLPEDVAQQLIQAGGYDHNFACGFVKGPRNCYFIGVDFPDTGDPTHFQEGSSPAVVADIWQWKGALTKIHRKHTFSMGVDLNTNGFQQTFNTGHLDFRAAQTASSTSSGVGGFSVASMLLGVPSGLTYRNVFETEHSGWVDGFYFQDQWKVTDKLTLNLGLRYDVTFVPVYGSDEDGNNRIGNFDNNTGNYILQRTAPDCATTGNLPPCIPGGTLPAHVLVSPDGRLWHNSYDNIQPRVGVAYRLTNRTVLRGSYGRFFDNWAAVLQMAQNQQGTWPSTGQFILTFNQNPGPPTVFAENPLQGATDKLAPLPTPFEQNNWFVDPNIKNSYSDQWNFGVQQAVTPSTTLTVNYVGSRGHRLDVGITANQATIPGPGLIPAVGCYTSTCAPALVAAQGRFPYPYQIPTHYDVSKGKSWYDALQVSLNQKTSHGLSYLLSYTWSKALNIGADEWFGTGTNGTSVQNPYNLAADKGLAGFDLPHLFAAHAIYELPFGKSGRFATGLRAVDVLIRDWQINGNARFSSGTLFNVVADNAIPNVGAVNGNSERANLVGDPRSGNCPSGARAGTLNCWFNIAAFAVPPSGTFGTFGRNVLRGGQLHNVDLSLFRSFPTTERTRLEFRVEAFNLTNSPVWENPRANISTNLVCTPTADGSNVAPCSPSGGRGRAPASNNLFGVVNATAANYRPRQIQFALKFYY